MRKIFYSLATVLCVLSCSKNLDQEDIIDAKNEMTLSASIAQFDNETKTALNGLNVVWSKGDQIKVFNAEGQSTVLTLSSDPGTVNGSFTGEEISDPVAAFYPADACTAYSTENGFTAAISDTQAYAENSVGNGAFPMVASVNGSSISFKNAFGILKLSLKGSGNVYGIVLTDLSNPIAGGFTITVDGTATASAAAADNLYKTTLSCSSVELDEDAATDFYIAVPAGSLSTGFTAEVLNELGHPMEVLYTTNDNTVTRSRIKKMPTKSGLNMSLPSDYTEVGYLQSDNSSTSASYLTYINTGVTVNASGTGMYVAEKFQGTKAWGFEECVMGLKEPPYFYFGQYYVNTSGSGIGFTFTMGSGNTVQTYNMLCEDGTTKLPDPGTDLCVLQSKFDNTSGYATSLYNGERHYKAFSTSLSYTGPIFMFGADYNYTTNSGNGTLKASKLFKSGKIYYATIIQDGDLKMNMIPCTATSSGTDANGNEYAADAPGFYNTANKKFYSNAGSGTFTVGTDANNSIASNMTEGFSNSNICLY